MTYIVKRDDKRFGKKVFESYEQARTYVRKWLRKREDSRSWDFSWAKYRNPSISDYGFSVERKTC
jgi:hypothetical protein